MSTKCLIRVSEYHDSVTLMELARELTELPQVVDAAVVMATEANKSILREADLLLPEIEAATANDLVVIVKSESDDAAAHALGVAEKHLAQRPAESSAEMVGDGAVFHPRTIRGAVRSRPEADLALISVPGQYAAAEAWEALRNGLHVLLFSDNVSIEDEVELKRYAVEHGLLMMGADCGTAIIDGVALGFANALERGPVGIVAASGTGLQEVSTLLVKLGVDVSQCIGTGGRDLKEAVGGITMLQAIDMLKSDPETKVLMLVSKTPAISVARRVLERLEAVDKPTIVCFLGGEVEPIVAAGALPARTLQEAALLAASEVEGYEVPSVDELLERELGDLKDQASELRERLSPDQKYLRGLFSGGTLASEALLIWEDMLGDVLSNLAVDPGLRLQDAGRSERHCAVDLGADEFTVGRPHPMIDNQLRIRRLMQEAGDSETAVIVLDVVLGYGAHPDPMSELGPAIREARELAAAQRRELIVVASVTGTENDPQGLSRQVEGLEGAGAIVASCNAAAARLAGLILGPSIPAA